MRGAQTVSAGRTVRILVIDPGSQRTGLGIINVDAVGKSRHVFHAVLNLLANDSFALRVKRMEAQAMIDRTWNLRRHRRRNDD